MGEYRWDGMEMAFPWSMLWSTAFERSRMRAVILGIGKGIQGGRRYGLRLMVYVYS